MGNLLEGFENAVCEIKTMDNELIFQGRLLKSGREGNSDYIEVGVRRNDTMPILPYGTRLKIDCMNNRRGMRALGGILYIANEDFWRITELNELAAYERRGFFRINARGTANIIPPLAKETRIVSARVVNISLSGALLEIPMELKLGERIHISHLRFDGFNDIFSFDAVVKRVVERSAAHVYGCSFENPKASDIDALCGVIFQLQREAIKLRRT